MASEGAQLKKRGKERRSMKYLSLPQARGEIWRREGQHAAELTPPPPSLLPERREVDPAA